MNQSKGIALPGKSMEEATRNAQKNFLSKNTGSVDTVTVDNHSEKQPAASAPPPKNKSATPRDDLQCLQAGIEKYTGIKEHGMSVWVVGKVKGQA